MVKLSVSQACCGLWSLLLSEEAAWAGAGLGRGTEPLLRCRATIFSSWRATRPSQRATWRWCSSSSLRTSAGRACLAATAATWHQSTLLREADFHAR